MIRDGKNEENGSLKHTFMDELEVGDFAILKVSSILFENFRCSLTPKSFRNLWSLLPKLDEEEEKCPPLSFDLLFASFIFIFFGEVFEGAIAEADEEDEEGFVPLFLA